MIPHIKIWRLIYFLYIIAKLQLPKSNLYEYYEKHKELVDTTVKDILNEERDNDLLLHILQNKVCEIITNRNLVTKNYKQYGFQVTIDHGAQVEMRGDVYSLLSACSMNKAIIHKNIKSNPLLGLKRKSKRKVRK